MELLWAGLLASSFRCRALRFLAALLAAKWGASYLAAFSGFWIGLAVVDILLAPAVAWGAMRLSGRAGRVIAVAHALQLLAHGWHWVLWDARIYVGVQYHYLMLGLFTAQTAALFMSQPGATERVQRAGDWLAGLGGGALDGIAPTPKQRMGRPKSR